MFFTCYLALNSILPANAHSHMNINTTSTQPQQEMTSMLPPAWIIVLLNLQVSPNLYVVSKRMILEEDRLLSKVNTLNGCGHVGLHLISPEGSPRFRHGWWKHPTHPDTSIMIWWTRKFMCQTIKCHYDGRKSERHSNLRRPSTNQVLMGLPFKPCTTSIII